MKKLWYANLMLTFFIVCACASQHKSRTGRREECFVACCYTIVTVCLSIKRQNPLPWFLALVRTYERDIGLLSAGCFVNYTNIY